MINDIYRRITEIIKVPCLKINQWNTPIDVGYVVSLLLKYHVLCKITYVDNLFLCIIIKILYCFKHIYINKYLNFCSNLGLNIRSIEGQCTELWVLWEYMQCEKKTVFLFRHILLWILNSWILSGEFTFSLHDSFTHKPLWMASSKR